MDLKNNKIGFTGDRMKDCRGYGIVREQFVLNFVRSKQEKVDKINEVVEFGR